MFVRFYTHAAYARARIAERLRRHGGDGGAVTTEYVILIVTVVALVLIVLGIIALKLTSKANSINL